MSVVAAQQFLFAASQGALGTLAGQQPFVSAINLVADLDGSVLMLVSALAEHTRNLAQQPACSLLLTTPGAGDLQASPRLTLNGKVEPIEDRAGERYLRVFPHTRDYLQLDFHFLRLRVERARWIAGFARAQWLAAADMAPPPGWTPAAEQALVAQHGPDLLAVDPFGAWFRHDDRLERLAFARPLDSPEAVAAALDRK